MNDAYLRKAILAALASWEKLDDAHKGPGYGESAAKLRAWAEELKEGKKPWQTVRKYSESS